MFRCDFCTIELTPLFVAAFDETGQHFAKFGVYPFARFHRADDFVGVRIGLCLEVPIDHPDQHVGVGLRDIESRRQCDLSREATSRDK